MRINCVHNWLVCATDTDREVYQKRVIMNRITRFSIKNFRCFSDIVVKFPEVSPLTFLIGLNGSGKTTFLQALGFVGSLMRGDVEEWLKTRGWTLNSLPTKPSPNRKSLIEIEVEGQVDISAQNCSIKKFVWTASFNTSATQARCTSEKITLSDSSSDEKIDAIKISDGRLFIDQKSSALTFNYIGSVLSQLNDKIRNKIQGLEEVYKFLSAIHSFDTLSTRNLRRPSFPAPTIGMNGENLAGYIANRSEQQQIQLSKPLHDFYSWLSHIETIDLETGKKALRVVENIGTSLYKKNGKYQNKYFKRAAINTNDGTLRLLAILSVIQFPHGIVLFDEIENGFNPQVIQKLIELLYESSQQIILSTHSPEILQYVKEDEIEESVKFFYRKKDGTTGIIDFFKATEPAKKLQRLLPGEVFLDTNIEELIKTIL